MGESAVLFHSYSIAAPHESHEDNTIKALSESISFGKFTSENLDWGKWSSFSHKKYVEEAEKYSRPGSVAQKKAFFEAHYKKIGLAKKSVAIEEQPALVLLNLQQDQEPVQIDDVVVVDDSLVVNDLVGELENDKEKKKKKKQEEELLKEEKRSITKNKPVFRLSLEKIIPPKAEIALSEKRSERPITQSSEMNEEKLVHRQRFSFLNCFFGNAKTQDQNQRSQKRKAEKKKKQQFLCLCLKPKTVRES